MAYLNKLIEIIKHDNNIGRDYDEYIEREVNALIEDTSEYLNLHEDVCFFRNIKLAYEYIYYTEGSKYRARLDEDTELYTIQIMNTKTNRWNIVRKNIDIKASFEIKIKNIKISPRYLSDDERFKNIKYLKYINSYNESIIFSKKFNKISDLPIDLLKESLENEIYRTLPSRENNNKISMILIDDDTKEMIETVIDVEYIEKDYDIIYDLSKS